jgi:hypothetical protein
MKCLRFDEKDIQSKAALMKRRFDEKALHPIFGQG